MLARGDHGRFTGCVLKRARKFERGAACASERRTAGTTPSTAGTSANATSRTSTVAGTSADTTTSSTSPGAATAAAALNEFGIGRLLGGKRH